MDCAAQFEHNVKSLSGVKDAKVNFGAAKITVNGNVAIEELEKAGAFENYKLVPENEQYKEGKEPFWKKRKNYNVMISISLLFIAWFISGRLGEESILSIIVYGASIVIGGYKLFLKGLKNLVKLKFDMNTLMTIAIIGASAIGEWREGAIVVILFAISEVLETYSMDTARRSIRSLMDIAPKEALVRREGKEITIQVADIQVNDIMIVKPGQKLAMDGVVIRGNSTINQAPITGESIPIAKSVNDEVFAGTINEEGFLEVKVTKRVEDTTISKIIHLVEEAQAERAPSQAFVDKFAKYYTPAIIIIAFLLAVIPPLLMGGDWNTWLYSGIAVLVVGCPCALVISTPISIVTAIGNAANKGVLIKGGIHLENAGALTAIAFDKTGTLTKGEPKVTDLVKLNEQDEKELLRIAAALEKKSQHPLAKSILAKATYYKININSVRVDSFSSFTGKGVKGKINGVDYYIGSPNLLNSIVPTGLPKEVIFKIEELQIQGKTVIILGTEKEAMLLIAVIDDVRENSKEAIQKLHSLGINRTIMLTGDNKATAKAIGAKLGIDEIEAELMPQDKLNYIKKIRNEKENVGMIGDGINDAPALAASSVGVAMGVAGTDTALETADIALMADDLRKLSFTIKLSRKTVQIIKQNIAFALGIKLLALALAVPGLLTLWLAIFADMGATLIVTLNGLRLLNVKED